jgi:[acyl-carrier-protein] S-malonyltransferase
LTQTVNLQPAVTAVNLAFLAAVRRAGFSPTVCAGHSLGEYSALCAAGIVTEAACLKLVFKRGELMHREASRNKGAMSAIVGLDIEQVRAVVADASGTGVVAVANHNSAEQIVITGSPDAVTAAGTMASERGARAIPLNVSGAWHSPLIQGAEEEFAAFIADLDFHPPGCDVIHNVTAATASDPMEIRSLMSRQLCSPVRWYDSVLAMVEMDVDVFVEIGPGRVLTGLLRKILPKKSSIRTYNVYDLKTLDKFVQAER